MATKKPETEEIMMEDPTTIVIEEKKQRYIGPTVNVFIPALEEEGSGVKVDQYEHVTIANEEKEEHWKIRRGTYVDIPVPVFAVLKDRYPNL